MSKISRLLILPALAACLAAGCTSRDALLRDVYTSRVDSYERWLDVHRGETESEARLKGKLSLEDALKLSLLHSKPLQAILEEKEKARGTIVEAYGEVLPTVKIRGGYTRLDEVGVSSVGGREISLGSPHNYNASLEVTQPLYRGGAIGAALKAARIFALLSDETVRAEVQSTIYNVAFAYYEVLLAQELHKVNVEAVELAKEFLDDVRKRVKGGVGTRFDELRARVELSNFQAEEIQQRNKINRSTTLLLKEMGVSQDSEVVLSDELEHRAFEPNLEEAVKTAFEHRPDLYQRELNVRLQREAVKIAISRYFPSFDAFFTHEWSNPNPHDQTDIDWGRAWNGGITLEWTLFDGLSREGKLIQERALLRQSVINLVDAEENATREIHAVVLSVEDAEAFYESQKSNVELAEEGYRLVKLGREGGVNTEVEVYDAQTALTRAKGFYYESVYSHTLARLEMERAMGTLGPPPGFRSRPEDIQLPKTIVPEAGKQTDVAPEEPQSNEG
ncbi:MAG: TolC family protein [Planctomycetota bacterium]